MRVLLATLALAGAIGAARAEGISARDVASAWPSQRATAGYATFYDCKRRGECSASKRTASGARFEPNAHACAHRAYPFGTRLRITMRSGHTSECRVNDRGPAKWTGNTIDVTPRVAAELGLRGRAFVTIERM